MGDIVGQWEKRVREKKQETAENLHQTRFFLMTDFMEEFAKLDTICLDWPDMLEACRIQMYHGKDSCVRYEERHYNRKRQNPETKRDLRNVFEYFVYSFLLSALYDEDLLTKVKMAVMCTMTIADLYVAADTLKLDDRIGICHALARQVENCDANRLMLEQILKKKTFSAARMMDAFISI